MGKKAERLEEELAILRTQVEDRVTSLQAENNALRSELAEALELGPPPARLITDARDQSTRAKIAQALGIDVPLGTEVSDEQLLDVIERLRGPTTSGEEGALVRKDETLAEAVKANRDQRLDLTDRLATAHSIIGSVAGALGVGSWNSSTGAEIVERAQRYSVLHNVLKKRHNDVVASMPARIAALKPLVKAAADALERAAAEEEAKSEHMPTAAATAASDAAEVGIGLAASLLQAELRTIIAMIVGDTQCAKLLATGKVLVASRTVLDVASAFPSQNEVPFSHADISLLAEIVSATAYRVEPSTPLEGARVRELEEILVAICASSVSSDLVAFMNAVVLPALRLHYQPPKAS